MADEVTRRAARLATLITLPIALVAGLVAFWALGGWHPARSPGASPSAVANTAPVPMPSRSMSAGAATMCLAFIAHLPSTLRELDQRPVTAAPEQNAAYGNPPIQVACGGWPAPSTAADARLWNLSGICWYADQSRADVTTWTTLDRQAPIRVTVPDSYQGQGGWVQEFSSPIVQWVPSLAHPPGICAAPSTAPS